MNNNKLYWIPVFTGMFLLFASTPVLADDNGTCIVCPTGYDCSSGIPVLRGEVGHILVRDADGTTWRILEASDVNGVPTTRTVAGLSLNEDITAAELRTALGL